MAAECAKEGQQGIEVGSGRAEGDKDVHVGPSALQHVPGTPVESEPRGELDQGCQEHA